jgi:hypothetical protein
MKHAIPIFIALFLATCNCSPAKAGDDNRGPLVRFEQNDKFGFRDETGKVVIEPIYDDAQDFTFGLAPVNIGAKWEFPGVRNGGKWGYINAEGKIVVPLTLTFAYKFSDGLALVYDDRGHRYIDPEGRTILALGDASCGDFREGAAPVHDWSFTHRDWQTKFIDKKGTTLFVVNGYAEVFHEGLAVLVVNDGANAGKKRYGFIDHVGKAVIAPQFAEALAFSDGLAAVRAKNTTGHRGMGNTWGYIDRSGKYVIEPRFNESHCFLNGVARAHVGGKMMVATDIPSWWEGGEWQLIDKQGNVLKRSDRWLRYEDAPVKQARSQDDLLVFEGTVASVEISQLPQSRKNFIVTVRVDRVIQGQFSGKTFQFRIHSPVQSGLEVGKKHTVEANRTKDGYTVDELQWMKREQGKASKPPSGNRK